MRRGERFFLIVAIWVMSVWALGFGTSILGTSSAWAQLSTSGFGGFGGGIGRSNEGPAKLVVSAERSKWNSQGFATLSVTATPAAGYYTYSVTQPSGGPIRTKITVSPQIMEPGFEGVTVEVVGDFQADPPPESRTEQAWGSLIVETHPQTVTWSATIRLTKVPEGVDWTTLRVTGTVVAQLCREGACEPPMSFAFTAQESPALTIPEVASVSVSPSDPSDPSDLVLSPVPEPSLEPSPEQGMERIPDGANGTASTESKFRVERLDPSKIAAQARKNREDQSFGWILGIAFLGGLILNLMPCVLPVLGLKILSLVEQAGESRRRVLTLNLWYTLGILSIFWVLAILAIFVQWSWGAQFQFVGFTVFMAIFVFAMSLSLLGIWELPIPGFASGRSAVSLTKREGGSGAFCKGMVTTLLATPCSGPFLGTALAWTLSQSPWAVLSVFTSMGLGMASPYLLIGAFPRWVKFLPKPGVWMETFREVLGFVLLGTVVFLLWTIPDPSVLLPTFLLGGGVWFGCWLIQRATLAGRSTWRSWVALAIITGFLVVFGFTGTESASVPERFRYRSFRAALQDRYQGLRWTPFTTQAAFEELVNQRQTVLIDFTADWCMTCKTLEATVLRSEPVELKLKENRVVTLVGDWTDGDPEVTKMLEMLGMRQVPVIAIFPAGRPNEPIVLADGYTRSMLLEALEQAGASEPLSVENER